MRVLPFAPPALRALLALPEPQDRWTLDDGRRVAIRAARPDDAERMQALVRSLSARTRYLRFFNPLRELPPKLLESFTHADPRHEMTLLAMVEHDGKEQLVGMGQYFSEDFPGHCEFAMLVADGWQGAGIGTRLLHDLSCLALAAGFAEMAGELLVENTPMRRLALSQGFMLSNHPGGAYLVKAHKLLRPPQWQCSALTALARRAAH